MKTETKQRQELTLMACTCFAFFSSGAASQPLGSFIPYLREAYGLDYGLSGILISCQSIGNLAAVLLTGILPAYLGRRKTVLTTAGWMAVGYAVFAAGFGNPAVLLLACLMMGMARGGNSNFANTMMSTLREPLATRGYNMAHGGFALGALISPLLLVAAQNRWPTNGWRIVAAVLGLLILIQVTVYATMRLPAEKPKSGLKAVDYSFLRLKEFWLGSAMLFFYIAAEYSIVGWLVTYFQESGVLPLEIAQTMNSLLWGIIFIGRLIGAYMIGRIKRSTLLLLDGAGFFAFFLVVFNGKTALTITLGIIGLGLFMAGVYPTSFSFGSEHIKGNDLAISIMTLTGSAAGVITPALVGVIAQNAGIRAGMCVVVIITAMLLCSILLSVFLSSRKPKTQNV